MYTSDEDRLSVVILSCSTWLVQVKVAPNQGEFPHVWHRSMYASLQVYELVFHHCFGVCEAPIKFLQQLCAHVCCFFL